MIRQPLTLASSSPRRRQLLEMLGIPLRVVAPNIPEVRRPVETPMDYVERLAREKALSVPGRLVLGADTTVVVRDEMLEKPADAQTRSACCGSCRAGPTSVTSVALVAVERFIQATDVTNVTFRRLDDAISEPTWRPASQWTRPGLRHSGLWGGAGRADRGDFFGVMGLPLRLVLGLLEEAGQPYRFEGRSGHRGGDRGRLKGWILPTDPIVCTICALPRRAISGRNSRRHLVPHHSQKRLGHQRISPGPASAQSRAATFTASPMTVYSSRRWLPMLPANTSPWLMPIPTPISGRP